MEEEGSAEIVGPSDPVGAGTDVGVVEVKFDTVGNVDVVFAAVGIIEPAAGMAVDPDGVDPVVGEDDGEEVVAAVVEPILGEDDGITEGSAEVDPTVGGDVIPAVGGGVGTTIMVGIDDISPVDTDVGVED